MHILGGLFLYCKLFNDLVLFGHIVDIILGAQWGDEGKGKIVDLLAKRSDVIIRFQGGNNAGHTIVNEFGKFPLHLVPSGIFSEKAISLIANGVVVDLAVLLGEIEMLEKAGIKVKNKLFVSPRAHVIMPYHKMLDGLYEQAKGKNKTGTTGRGIGPVYADKVSYNGIRIGDLFDVKVFKEKLQMQLNIKNKIIVALGGEALDFKKVFNEYQALAKQIQPFVKETFTIIQNALEKKQHILVEGAQAVFLDNDWGTYPFVTASSIASGAITGGAGIAPKHIKKIIGIAKAYTTRVGDGPFPTELLDKHGEQLRELGNEYGTTTGRPRRCGWFDAELIRFAVKLNGMTGVVITKLDILGSFKKIKVCVGYTLNRKRVHYEDGDSTFLSIVKPVYESFDGWNEDISNVTKYDDLPANCKKYLSFIEKIIGVPIVIVSVGPDRKQTIIR